MAASSLSNRRTDAVPPPLQFGLCGEGPPRWVSPSVEAEWPDYFPDRCSETDPSLIQALHGASISHPEPKESYEGLHDKWRQYAKASEQLLKPSPDDRHEHCEGYDVYVRTLDMPSHSDLGLGRRYFVKIMKDDKIVQDFNPPIGVYDPLIPDTPFIPIAGMNVFQLPAENMYEIKYKGDRLLCAFGGTIFRETEYQSFTHQ